MGQSTNKQTMHDIRDGEGVRDLPHPDGGKFFDGRAQLELRTSWTLAFDAFNPFFNKAAGKTASSAVLCIACNNLPPSLKHQPENLFLITVLPKDPSVVQIPFSLRVIFEGLNQHWKTGIYVEHTPSSPNGFRERSIISNIVADMIGGSKIAGHAQHNSAKYFCDLCLLLKDNINCIHTASLPLRTKETEYASACRWRDATSAEERNEIFKETGIRWAVLYYLEYWDPTKMLASDPMHNLFLGLVQYHCRVVMGIDWNKKSKNAGQQTTYKSFENSDMNVLGRGRAVLAKATSIDGISKLAKNVLWMLCAENDIDLEALEKANRRKLMEELWVSTRSLDTAHWHLHFPRMPVPEQRWLNQQRLSDQEVLSRVALSSVRSL